MNKTRKIIKRTQAQQNWIDSHNFAQSPVSCICECGQPLGDFNYIFKHRQTKKHKDLLIKSDNKMIQERHEALPDYVKKIDDIYVKKTGDFYVKPTKNQTCIKS